MYANHPFVRSTRTVIAHRALAVLFFALLDATVMPAMSPARAAEFSVGRLSQMHFLHRVAVFSDDPETIYDPRHLQPQTDEDRTFAPIGLISTNQPVPHQNGAVTTLNLDMATAFLVSPCYVLTNYHVIFGNQKSEPAADRDYAATFRAGGKKSRAVPIKHGRFYAIYWQDWVLLRLDSDAEHPCLGEDANIGWVRLTPLPSDVAPNKALSTAGYPSDKAGLSLWRQDRCHLFEKEDGRQYSGLWTTDCPTRPRASGSPIFFVQDGVLMVVALMEGHLGSVNGNEILPKWDPNRANLAVDMGKILSSDADILKLITLDIDRYYQADPARTVVTDTNQIKQPNQLQVPQPGDASAVAPPAPSDNIRAVQPQPSQTPSEPGP